MFSSAQFPAAEYLHSGDGNQVPWAPEIPGRHITVSKESLCHDCEDFVKKFPTVFDIHVTSACAGEVLV